MRGPRDGVRVVSHSTSGEASTTGPRSSSPGIAIHTSVGAARRAPNQAATCSHTLWHSAEVGADLRRASARRRPFVSAPITMAKVAAPAV